MRWRKPRFLDDPAEQRSEEPTQPATGEVITLTPQNDRHYEAPAPAPQYNLPKQIKREITAAQDLVARLWPFDHDARARIIEMAADMLDRQDPGEVQRRPRFE